MERINGDKLETSGAMNSLISGIAREALRDELISERWSMNCCGRLSASLNMSAAPRPGDHTARENSMRSMRSGWIAARCIGIMLCGPSAEATGMMELSDGAPERLKELNGSTNDPAVSRLRPRSRFAQRDDSELNWLNGSENGRVEKAVARSAIG